jgi:hypothetical protein
MYEIYAEIESDLSLQVKVFRNFKEAPFNMSNDLRFKQISICNAYIW